MLSKAEEMTRKPSRRLNSRFLRTRNASGNGPIVVEDDSEPKHNLTFQCSAVSTTRRCIMTENKQNFSLLDLADNEAQASVTMDEVSTYKMNILCTMRENRTQFFDDDFAVMRFGTIEYNSIQNYLPSNTAFLPYTFPLPQVGEFFQRSNLYCPTTFLVFLVKESKISTSSEHLLKSKWSEDCFLLIRLCPKIP